jgi:hypothetical protein
VAPPIRCYYAYMTLSNTFELHDILRRNKWLEINVCAANFSTLLWIPDSFKDWNWRCELKAAVEPTDAAALLGISRSKQCMRRTGCDTETVNCVVAESQHTCRVHTVGHSYSQLPSTTKTPSNVFPLETVSVSRLLLLLLPSIQTALLPCY